MSIKPLPITDFDSFIKILADAYPGIKLVTNQDKQAMKQRMIRQQEDPTVQFYGFYRSGVLQGGMRCNDFIINIRSHLVKAGGVGSIAVDLLHKKEKIAKTMMIHFLQHYRQQGAVLALLYPFRPDFYRKMGFGYGTKMNQYRLAPLSLPTDGSKGNLRYLTHSDQLALNQCYQRVLATTPGLIEKSAFELSNIFRQSKNKIVAYQRDGQVQGYLIFQFETTRPDNFLLNDLRIVELVYEHREALSALLAFLRSQADQIKTIIFNTQDENFHYLLHDPRNNSNNLNILYHESNTQGVGIMYRVINIPRLFHALRECNFGNQTCRLKVSVTDTFLPDNGGDFYLQFQRGYPTVTRVAPFDVEISLDIAEFSALMMGCVNFRTLYAYKLAEISNPDYVDTLEALFYTRQKPVCTTIF